MRIIKLGIISFIILAILITGISLFVPSKVTVSRAVNMAAVPDSVWARVDDLHRWEEWNPLFENLASKKVEYIDTSNGHWNAVKVATTTVQWKEKKTDEHIAEMRNGDRSPVMSGWKCVTYPGRDSITVQWYMVFRLKWYPWEKFGSLMFEKQYGTQMEKGLSQLKSLLEK